MTSIEAVPGKTAKKLSAQEAGCRRITVVDGAPAHGTLHIAEERQPDLGAHVRMGSLAKRGRRLCREGSVSTARHPIKPQELSRDDETGVVKLRATPLNGDTIYVEIGAPATIASQRLSGRDYETAEMVVSCLAVDSAGRHETEDPLAWHTRITIKSRGYDHGGDKVVELRPPPPAPLRYTTDGSDPKVAGGLQRTHRTSPGTRLVLAIAEEKGTPSEVHQVTVNWNKPVGAKPIDTAAPATWTPFSHPKKVFRFNTSQPAISWSRTASMPSFGSALRRRKNSI
jgi:hypothetical protein